jgi:ribonuclease-3
LTRPRRAAKPGGCSESHADQACDQAQLRESDLVSLAESWGISGVSPALLAQALLHSSAVPPRSSASNERLEFLGDSIVNCVTAEFLYATYPDRNEGDLAKARALVVSKLALYEVGVRMGLPDKIAVGANAEGALARGRRSLVADAVEAVVAATYLELGWDTAKSLVLRLLEPELAQLVERRDLRDAKSILQERAQSKHDPVPEYVVIGEEGRTHDCIFTVEVRVHNGPSAIGSGRSKKDAQQAAAAAVLEILGEQSNESGS